MRLLRRLFLRHKFPAGAICFFSLWMTCLFSLLSFSHLQAEEKIQGTVSVRDTLALPGHPARIEATLVREGLAGRQGLGGEQLELIVGGKTAGQTMTGGDGRAVFEYTPKVRGNHELMVRVLPNPRVLATEGKGTLGSWERRKPILLVEVAALVQEKKAPLFPSVTMKLGKQAEPEPGAVEELKRLAKFYYNVIYLSWSPKDGTDELDLSADGREWLKQHRFPIGLWIAVKPGDAALGSFIDELRKDGWTNVRAGLGRTKAFAEALVAHRLEVVIVAGPTSDELPKKAKPVKGWKEVRKKL